MTSFKQSEIDRIEAFWRTLPQEHPWSGWAIAPSRPDEMWIFRTKRNWRRFFLRKTDTTYELHDEVTGKSLVFKSLQDLAEKVTEVPALDAMWEKHGTG